MASPFGNRNRLPAGLILGTLLAIQGDKHRYPPKFRQIIPLRQKKLPGFSDCDLPFHVCEPNKLHHRY